MISFVLNNETIHTDLPAGMTVLDFVRHHQHLKGTKIGCREGDCGACTLLVGELKDDDVHYKTMTSCLMPMSNARNKHIVTVEGINAVDGTLSPVQQSMMEENGTQCGFCTIGFVMSLTGYCLDHKHASHNHAIASIDGNICRCTGYKSIERAADRITALLENKNGVSALVFAMKQGIVPEWFAGIKERLQDLQEHGEKNISPKKNIIVGGGTDLYVQQGHELMQMEVKSIFDIDDYNHIREENGRIEIGSAVTVTDLMESPIIQNIFPILHKHLKLVSSTPIRNMSTVGGNLVNASPIGDLTIWFLAMDATVVVSNGKKREIPLRDFYTGYKTLEKTAVEIVEKIYFRKPGNDSFFNFEKVSKRQHLDIATVNTAIQLFVKDNLIYEAHVSAGGVSPIPLYLKNLSSCLKNQKLPFSRSLWKELDHILQSEISPISDVRGSNEYKRLLLQQLFHAHFIELFPAG